MHLRNPLTTPRADARYTRQAWTRADGFDNATDRYPLGLAAAARGWRVEYLLELPVSGRAHSGTILVTHAGGAAVLADHGYAFDGAEIGGLTWTAELVGGAVNLVLQKVAVGENPTVYYRVHAAAD